MQMENKSLITSALWVITMDLIAADRGTVYIFHTIWMISSMLGELATVMYKIQFHIITVQDFHLNTSDESKEFILSDSWMTL